MASSSSTADSTSRYQTRKKYKDSCNNCAASKVKCNRDKPQCSRCEDRGLTCFYSLSQRSGRRPTASQPVAPADTKFHDNNSSKDRLLEDDSDNVESKQRKISSDEYASTTKSDGMDFTTFAAPSVFSPSTFGNCDFSGMTPWGFPAAAPNSNTTTPQGIDVDSSYMDYFPELLDDQTLPWLTDTSSGTSLPGNSLESSDSGIFSGVAGHGQSIPAAFSAQTTPSSVSSSSRRSCCSTRASELYKQVRVQGAKFCVKEQPSQPETKAAVVSFEDVINTNRECINNIIDMLDCPCSAVQQTVIIISMIVFEVLDRYHTTALECAKGFACMVPNGQSPNKQGLRSSKYAIEGPDARYMRISCILGELHLVVRLMELLSRRSKGNHQSDSLMHDLAGRSPVLATKSISASVFVQVEADMRKRLSTVRESLILLMRQT